MDKNILSKITKWLRDEIKHNEPILNESEKLSDDTFDIHLGRSECAISLLEQIEKWKEEN